MSMQWPQFCSQIHHPINIHAHTWPQCPAGDVTVVVSTIYIQSVHRYSALEALCYLDTVECCSPDTPPAIPHRRWGWSSLLSSSSCVSEFGSLWSTAGNSWTTFPRIPIGHLVAGMKFGHLSSLSLQPKLATNIKHILFSILESKQGKQITLKKYTSRSRHLSQSAKRVRNFLWIQIGDTLLYGFIAKLSSQPVMKQQLARYNAGTKWARFPCTLTHTYIGIPTIANNLHMNQKCFLRLLNEATRNISLRFSFLRMTTWEQSHKLRKTMTFPTSSALFILE